MLPASFQGLTISRLEVIWRVTSTLISCPKVLRKRSRQCWSMLLKFKKPYSTRFWKASRRSHLKCKRWRASSDLQRRVLSRRGKPLTWNWIQMPRSNSRLTVNEWHPKSKMTSSKTPRVSRTTSVKRLQRRLERSNPSKLIARRSKYYHPRWFRGRTSHQLSSRRGKLRLMRKR